MHIAIEERIKHGRGARVYALLDEGGVRRLVALGDFDDIRYRFNQMVCLAGGHAIEQLLAAAFAPGAPAGLPTGAWTDRTTGGKIVLPADCYAVAATGPSDTADILGAMARLHDWPDGMTSLRGMKQPCSSLSEVGDLFYNTRDTYTVRTGRPQERSAVKRVDEAIQAAHRMGYRITGETELRTFMLHYAGAKYLQVIHTVD